MDPISEVKQYEADSELLPLMIGGPGPDTLRDCKDIFLKATSHVLDKEADVTQAFRYGHERGDIEFRDELAKFLSMEYRETVSGSNLMLTAGATQAIHMIATLLFKAHTKVFIEDPTYYAAYRMLETDFQMDIVPVRTDKDGIDTKKLDELLTKHRPEKAVTPERPFWSLIYVITVFSNPTGRSYSQERCAELVRLARKHDVLILCEDIYNLIYFGDSCPKRLLAYDNKSDPDYKGHVLSNCTFSKILAPGLRLGWLEAPERVLDLLQSSNMQWSGGSLNHYASKLAAAILKLGMQENHVQLLRNIYKERMQLMGDFLEKNLPPGSVVSHAQGGFFTWVQLPDSIDTMVLLRMAVKKYKINFLPGFCTSPSGHFKNCVRLSISFCNTDQLNQGLDSFCRAVNDYLSGNVE